MDKLKLVISVALFTALTACKKDEVETPVETAECGTTEVDAPSTVLNFFPTTAGSYWIYESVNVDTLGIETPYGQNDTVTVIGDTVFNGNTYTIFEGTWLSTQTKQWYYRDSANYIVISTGTLVFTDQPTTDTLAASIIQGFGWSYKTMVTPPASITTPVGTFTSILYPRTDIWANNPNYLWGHPRSNHSYLAEGVGNIYQTMFFTSSPNFIERRLIAYYITQ